jgi:lysophospholipase L1-like esterase
VYLRYAALGDSATVGIGDPVPGGWRGWSRLLHGALASGYDVSYCNLAASGATSGDVLTRQLDEAVAHRPDVASLVVGINDTMRASWDPGRLRHDLMSCAEALTEAGATLLTARFHDHGAVFGLPRVVRRPLFARIEVVNAVYDEIHHRFGGHRIDLGSRPEVIERAFWSVDRLHPSERGHRALARAYADALTDAGLLFEPPRLEPNGGEVLGWRQDVSWMVREGAPWVGRRARDLGPWAMRLAWEETRQRAVATRG